MKKIHLLVLVMVFLGLDVVAQDSGFGVRAGLNITSVSNSELNSKVGFHIGGLYSMPLMSSVPLFFEPGFMLQLKGGRISENGATNKVNAVYMEIPAIFSYRLEINNTLSIVPSFGPFFALGIAGKNKISSGGSSESYDVFGDDGTAKRGDMGVKIAVGALLFQNIYVGMGYDASFLNVDKSDNGGKVRNGSFNISAGYYF